MSSVRRLPFTAKPPENRRQRMQEAITRFSVGIPRRTRALSRVSELRCSNTRTCSIATVPIFQSLWKRDGFRWKEFYHLIWKFRNIGSWRGKCSEKEQDRRDPSSNEMSCPKRDSSVGSNGTGSPRRAGSPPVARQATVHPLLHHQPISSIRRLPDRPNYESPSSTPLARLSPRSAWTRKFQIHNLRIVKSKRMTTRPFQIPQTSARCATVS